MSPLGVGVSSLRASELHLPLSFTYWYNSAFRVIQNIFSAFAFLIFENTTYVPKYYLGHLISEPSLPAEPLIQMWPCCQVLSARAPLRAGRTAQVLWGQPHSDPEPIREGKVPQPLVAKAAVNDAKPFLKLFLGLGLEWDPKQGRA